jgi:hypothetical protein
MYLNLRSGKRVATMPAICQKAPAQGGAIMQSRATTQWEGDLMSGKGKTSAGSGTFRDLNLSWKARTEGAASNTTLQ